jgi:uncharacterized protein GlcG (DUF336 family)
VHVKLATPYNNPETTMTLVANSLSRSFARTAVAALLLTSAAWAQAQSAPGLVVERGLSMNTALELATASLERCRADGYKVTITVLNRHARAAVVLSDDGANPHTTENSLRKAYTAFTTKAPSVELGKRPQPNLMGFLQLDKITTIEGGLPVFAGKDLVGAIGISGAPGGEKDTACAQVGIDKISKALGN